MKNLWKKVQKMVLCTLALAMVAAMSAAAAGSTLVANNVRFTEGTIDTSLTASMTIHKYSYGGDGNTGTGLPSDAVPEGAVPLQGVSFKYYKVADVISNTSATGNVSLMYQLNDVFKNAFGMADSTCSSDELNDWLKNANINTLENTVNGWTTGGSVTTDASGIAAATNLPLGLYLVIENASPASVAVKVEPFFVSLPMTNAGTVTIGDKSYEAGRLWQYDVHVFPKNLEEIPDIEKNVIDNVTGKEEKYESASVGETVVFQIKATIPKHVDSMAKYTVVDTMSSGLDYIKVREIKAGETVLTLFAPEQVSSIAASGEKTLIWNFIQGSDNALTGHGGKQLVITYEAKLNEKCVVGGWGNPNSVKLVYNHQAAVSDKENPGDPDDVVEHTTKSRIYTFGIEITKVDANQTNLKDVEFKLYEDEAGTKEIKVNAGAVNGSTDQVNSYYPSENGSAVIKTDNNGRAYIWGLKTGTYYLKETKAPAGYQLLKEMIRVTIQENVSYSEVPDNTEGKTYGNRSGAFYKLVAGEYVPVTVAQNTGYYNFGTDAIYTKNADDSYTKVVDLSYAKVTAGSDEFSTDNDKTRVMLTVVNNKQFLVPQTGGMGTWMFIVCGAVIVLASAGLILVRRKRNLSK